MCMRQFSQMGADGGAVGSPAPLHGAKQELHGPFPRLETGVALGSGRLVPLCVFILSFRGFLATEMKAPCCGATRLVWLLILANARRADPGTSVCDVFSDSLAISEAFLLEADKITLARGGLSHRQRCMLVGVYRLGTPYAPLLLATTFRSANINFKQNVCLVKGAAYDFTIVEY